MPPILYLIDGHALAYRTYFALMRTGAERWHTSAGEPTAGIYGFASALLRLLEKERPEYLAVAFDTGKTFRNDLYPKYKATRAKMPDDLRPQITRIREMVDAFHFPRLEMEGFEADDILGSLAQQAVRLGLGVKIITGDRDLLQLVDDRIIVNLPDRQASGTEDFTAQKVVEYMGIQPKQIIDYKALAGDTSDNIPGVAGVGDKTAISLLQKYPDLETIYAHLDELAPRVRKNLEAGRESAFTSYKLATIRTDVALTLKLEEARTDHMNIPALEDLFRKLEFKSLLPRLKALSGQSQQAPGSLEQLSLFGQEITRVGEPAQYQLEVRLVNTPEMLQTLVADLKSADLISLDTETTSTNPLVSDLVGISLAVHDGYGYYIPVGHKTGETQLPLQGVVAALKPIFSDERKSKGGHNIKYDVLVLGRYGLEITPITFDTMIAGWLVDPASRRLGLKDMADDYLSIRMTRIDELIGKGRNQRSMANVPIDIAAPYAAADAEVSLRLYAFLLTKLKEHNADRLFKEMEMPLVPVLIEMERNGVSLDVEFFHKMSGELSVRMEEIEQQIHTAVGQPFNLNSTQQLSKILFEDLHLEPPRGSKRTTSGQYSTSAEVLEEMRGEHPVVNWILEYRELAKLKSTYVDALPQELNPKTHRVHTSFNQTGSVTGRLASSDPNLQNIPIRTDIGRRVRQGFVASPGMMLLSVDYSQIELRIVAHMSGDKAMLQAFRAGQDIHAATAAAIYNIPLDQVNKDQRRHAKTINFGLIYGMSSYGLSRSTDLTWGEAEDFVAAYFKQFPGVKQYLDNLRKVASRQGYVETLLGRRRYFPNLSSQANSNLRSREEREAINAPIQGTAADIMKLAMISLFGALAREKLVARLLLQVHDELVLECPPEQLELTARVVRQIMENAYSLSIPLLTEARSGHNWGAMDPLESSR